MMFYIKTRPTSEENQWIAHSDIILIIVFFRQKTCFKMKVIELYDSADVVASLSI